MSIGVLLVDDHRMLRDGLRAVLQGEGSIEVVGEAADGREAVQLAEELAPDVVVMDVSMPTLNGIEATRQIIAQRAEAKVLALSMYSDKRYVVNMLAAGARGFVVKSSAGDDLVKAVQAVASGESYLSVDSEQGDDSGRVESAVLGARERQVLQLLAEGMTSRQIGSVLHIATKTVETHRRNIMRKLGLHSVAELTKFAIREGLTPLET